MTETALSPSPDARLRLRTLVLDADESRREALTKILTNEGLRVFSCGNIEQGRQVFDEHALVIAPLNGDSQAVVDFVHWLRTRSGRTQPYVLGVGEYHGPASEWHGFNEFVPGPLDEATARNCLEAARRWHGWTVEINQGRRPALPPPVLRRTTEPEITSKPEDPSPAAVVADSFDWNAAVSDEPLETPSEPEMAPTPLRPLPTAVPPALAENANVTVTDDMHLQINEASPFGLLLLDDAANLIYANPQHRGVLGITVDEAGGLASWLEFGCAVEPQKLKATLDTWWERVWRRRLPLVLTMRSAESLLKEIEFRPSRLSDERLLVAIFDVTDARREEESMRTSEARFRNLFLQMPSRVVVVNAAGNITDVSTAFEQLVGCSRLDMRRLGLDQFFPEEDLVNMRKNAFSARQGKATPTFAVKLQPREGPLVPLVCSISIVKNSSGAAVFTAFYFQEESVTAPASPEPSPQPQPKILGISPDFELVFDEERVVRETMIGRDFAVMNEQQQSFVGRRFEDAFPTLAAHLPLSEMVSELTETLDAEVRCQLKVRLIEGGPPIACEARLIAILPSEGEKRQLGLIVRNVSRAVGESVTADRQPPSSEPAKSAMQHMAQAVVTTNEKGRICDLNPAAERIFGYARVDLMDAGLYQIFKPDQPQEFARKISEVINLHHCWIGETDFTRKDGSVGQAHVELVPYENAEDRGFMGFVREIVPAPEPSPPPAQPGSVITLHRARNDLQVLSSLLSMQAADATIDEVSRQALQAGKDRVSAVALVYRLLDGETGLVDFSKLVEEMSQQILRSHRITGERVTISHPVESSKIPQKLAITLGLIVQELLNTLLIHTFPKPAKGRIVVDLRQGHGECILSVRDNGPFQTSAMLESRTNGFGWQIVEALSQQLGGKLTVLSDLENDIALRFDPDIHAAGPFPGS